MAQTSFYCNIEFSRKSRIYPVNWEVVLGRPFIVEMSMSGDLAVDVILIRH
jgi:hypothetical protein